MVASFLVTIQPSRLISVIPGPRFANSVDNISLANAGVAVTSEHNLVAYRPRLSAGHGSRLGVLLFNIHGIFPCLNLTRGFPAICTRYTLDEDGFLGGRPFIEAADGGNNWRIFSTTENIVTYGIGLKGCPELNRACLPNYAAFAVSCLLPRGNCG